MAQAYADAKAEREKSEAKKMAEEAAEIAARSDLGRQRVVKEFSEAVDRIFQDGQPPVAQMLKLAKLVQENPDLAAQLDKLEQTINILSLQKGFNIQPVDDQPSMLPSGEEVEPG